MAADIKSAYVWNVGTEDISIRNTFIGGIYIRGASIKVENLIFKDGSVCSSAKNPSKFTT